MGNRSKYWCKRRVRLKSMSTGQVFSTRFCAFASLYFFTKSLHKKLPVTWALSCTGMHHMHHYLQDTEFACQNLKSLVAQLPPLE
jgi:hypothetical protein